MKKPHSTFSTAAALTSLVLILVAKNASAQSTLMEGWENSLDGWGLSGGANMVINGFSATTGVTQGSYSLVLGDANPGSGPSYATQIGSASSTAYTADLAGASSMSLSVYYPGGEFGYYVQIEAALYQSALGYVQLPGGYQTVNGGTETTLTFTLPPADAAIIAANPTEGTEVQLLIGGGYTSPTDAVYLDNLVANAAVPEPGTMALFGMGAVGALTFARRRSA